MSEQGVLNVWLEKLYKCVMLSEEEVKILCEKAKEVFRVEKTLHCVSAPCVVVAEIHGQWEELMEVFQIAGRVPDSNYLFLGDYVDRGYHSIQTISLLVCLKVCFPDRIHILRGNHESRQETQVYGFYDECIRCYGSVNVWRYFTDLFDYFPLCMLIDEKIFCLHGGLSPDLNTMDQIQELDRFHEPIEGPILDLLNSEPGDAPGWTVSHRGSGHLYGEDITTAWNHTNHLSLLARSHTYIEEGARYTHQNQVLTIFSVSNYCYICGNKGAFLEIDQNHQVVIRQYSATTVRINSKK